MWPDKPLGWYSICNKVQIRKKGNTISGKNPDSMFQLASSRPTKPPQSWWKMAYQFTDALNHSCVIFNMTQKENFQVLMSASGETSSGCTFLKCNGKKLYFFHNFSSFFWTYVLMQITSWWDCWWGKGSLCSCFCSRGTMLRCGVFMPFFYPLSDELLPSTSLEQ